MLWPTLSEAPIPQADIGRLETFSARIAQMPDLESLVATTLSSLAALFGYEHSFLLAADEDRGSLYTVGSHGFDASGVGSDVRIGEGLIGVAAESRLPVRVTNMNRQLLYGRQVRSFSDEASRQTDGSREIPLPGLPEVQSRLAMPLVFGGRLVGVLCLQSPEIGRFQAVDEQVVAIACRQLSAAMAAMSVEPEIEPPRDAPCSSEEGPASVRHYAADDSVFIEDRYLIKGVAGRILWLLLRDFTSKGRLDFSNKELRVDPKLGLPGFRDNLETGEGPCPVNFG